LGRVNRYVPTHTAIHAINSSFPWECPPDATFERVEDKRSEPVTFWTDNPVVDDLILSGERIVMCETTLYWRFHAGIADLSTVIKGKPRILWEWHIGKEGFLRLEFEDADTVTIALLYIWPEHQGKGLGKKFLNCACKRLCVTTKAILGRPHPTAYPTVKPMSPERLMAYYIKHCQFKPHPTRAGWIIRTSPFLRATENN
jgi:GNAT superfamily N-acetyltransferase